MRVGSDADALAAELVTGERRRHRSLLWLTRASGATPPVRARSGRLHDRASADLGRSCARASAAMVVFAANKRSEPPILGPNPTHALILFGTSDHVSTSSTAWPRPSSPTTSARSWCATRHFLRWEAAEVPNGAPALPRPAGGRESAAAPPGAHDPQALGVSGRGCLGITTLLRSGANPGGRQQAVLSRGRSRTRRSYTRRCRGRRWRRRRQPDGEPTAVADAEDVRPSATSRQPPPPSDSTRFSRTQCARRWVEAAVAELTRVRAGVGQAGTTDGCESSPPTAPSSVHHGDAEARVQVTREPRSSAKSTGCTPAGRVRRCAPRSPGWRDTDTTVSTSARRRAAARAEGGAELGVGVDAFLPARSA